MDYGKISEVVMGFKRIIDNIPSQFDNFDDALDLFFEAFNQTMDEMIPLKFYAYTECEAGCEVDIFDSAKERYRWLRELKNLCGDEFEICKDISPAEFLELSQDEWSNPNYYASGVDGVLTFVL